MAYYLGLDVGTSGTKALLITEAGQAVASDTQAYPLSTPQPQWAEQDPADWWQAAVKATRTVLAQAGIRIVPSEANFVLADFGTPADADAADAALRRRGIIVRAMRAYNLPHCLRITVGTAEECDMVAEALTGRMVHG